MTAIVAGLVAAVFGGSNVQVSGPTGAMTVVLVPVVARFGADAVFVVGLMAGVLILAASFARLGRYLAYIPWPVIEGFTVGIAVIIFLQQVPSALGVPKPDGENTAVVAGRALVDAFGAGSLAAVAAGRAGGRGHGGGAPPAPVAAGVAARGRRGHRGRPGGGARRRAASARCPARCRRRRCRRCPPVTSASCSPPRSPSPCSPRIESLLSAKVADGMADTGRHDPDRELFGQGLANLASPLFGGMPATGAIARTAVNVRAGARTRVSAIVHSLVLVLVVSSPGRLVARDPAGRAGRRADGHRRAHGGGPQRPRRAALDPLRRRRAGPDRGGHGGVRPHRRRRDRRRRRRAAGPAGRGPVPTATAEAVPSGLPPMLARPTPTASAGAPERRR